MQFVDRSLRLTQQIAARDVMLFTHLLSSPRLNIACLFSNCVAFFSSRTSHSHTLTSFSRTMTSFVLQRFVSALMEYGIHKCRCCGWRGGLLLRYDRMYSIVFPVRSRTNRRRALTALFTTRSRRACDESISKQRAAIPLVGRLRELRGARRTAVRLARLSQHKSADAARPSERFVRSLRKSDEEQSSGATAYIKLERVAMYDRTMRVHLNPCNR